MSEFKGTKTPWTVFKNTVFFEVNSDDENGCARLRTNIMLFKDDENGNSESNSLSEESEANAKLISCSPEMLEMLEQSLYRLENTNNVAFCDAIRKLIKKATE